jgi:hypothetical protein
MDTLQLLELRHLHSTLVKEKLQKKIKIKEEVERELKWLSD